MIIGNFQNQTMTNNRNQRDIEQKMVTDDSNKERE